MLKAPLNVQTNAYKNYKHDKSQEHLVSQKQHYNAIQHYVDDQDGK